MNSYVLQCIATHRNYSKLVVDLIHCFALQKIGVNFDIMVWILITCNCMDFNRLVMVSLDWNALQRIIMDILIVCSDL